MVEIGQIKSQKWYRQSGAGVPFLIGIPFWAIATRMKKRSGLLFPDDMAIFKKQNDIPMWYHYFNLEKAKDELKIIFDHLQARDGHFEKLRSSFDETGMEMIQLGDEIQKLDIDEQGYKDKAQKMFECALEFWENSLFLDLMDPFQEEIVEFIFGKKRKISPEELNILMSPRELSCIQQEEADLLNIVRSYQRDQETEIVDKLLKQHASKYHWLRNDYLQVNYLDEDYFGKRVREVASNQRELDGMRANLSKLKENRDKQSELITKLELDEEILRKLRFFNEMINFRDERKKINLISHYYLLEMLRKVSDKNKIDLTLAVELLPWELLDFINQAEDFRDELDKRKKTGLLIFGEENKLSFLSGDEVGEYFDELETSFVKSEFSGSSASRGKIIAPAKIIYSTHDFEKMKTGDVLVAPMTRPEYLPVLKMASAIVTDEGGITCHAAIISRELGIPCVTGTQVATKVLKDGDIVDVNANHGVIKIIN